MRKHKRFTVTIKFAALLLIGLMAMPPDMIRAASHREAPITALDRQADITDYYAFVSYDNPDKVTFILCVDPLLEPANGPNYFPFDPDILYAIKIDNNNDAVEDISFEFRFNTEIRAPGVFTGFVGAGSGIPPLIPPAVTALDGPGSEGFSLRQNYTVTMVRGAGASASRTQLNNRPLYAVPTNVGPRTMPNYPALANQGNYDLGNGVKVFAGTTDDAFWIDLGAAFDSLNLRKAVLTDAEDANDTTNFTSDAVSGYNVNTIAIEVPISMVTRDGRKHPASDAEATIGTWGTTSRPLITVRSSPSTPFSRGPFRQIQRMGNPLINELLIPTGSKDYWSVSEPKDDGQFAGPLLDPLLAKVLNAVFQVSVPPAPRTDLLPLVTYAPPIAAPGTTAGPVADLLRLNTGVPPTPSAQRKRLGLLAGDAAGFPNGRRVSDDVTDIALRVVAGVLNPAYNINPNNRLGDGVNANDVPYRETFPYVGYAQSGRNRRHIDPGEPGGGPAGEPIN